MANFTCNVVVVIAVVLLSENPCEAEYAITINGTRVGRAVIPIEFKQEFEALFQEAQR